MPLSRKDHPNRRAIGIALAATLFTLILIAPQPPGLSAEGWRTAAVAAAMAVLWASEAIPVPATALLPLLLFPLMGVSPIKETAAPYAHPLIFLFLGGFMIALAMQRWDLHRRVALNVVAAVGGRPQSLVVGFMAATALLSMWVSNTATTMLMLPVAGSVIGVCDDHLRRPGANAGSGRDDVGNFAICLMLGIAYAASIGGIGTLVGTPPNALLAAYLSETFRMKIGFADWMVIGLPVVAIMLPAAWLVLTRLVYPFRLSADATGASAVRMGLEQLGPVSGPEKRVAAVFVVVALAWITRPFLAQVPGLGGLDDTSIAVFGALALFVLPAGPGYEGALVGWDDAKNLPWGVLILFGGGLSLSHAFSTTGLAKWLGDGIAGLGITEPVVLVLAVVALIIFLTELTSNTATTATFLPVLGSVAVGAGIAPLELTVPAVVAASCAFMLPVATPPNAIVFGSGCVTIPQMVRAGVVLNIVGIVLVTLFAELVLPHLLRAGL